MRLNRYSKRFSWLFLIIGLAGCVGVRASVPGTHGLLAVSASPSSAGVTYSVGGFSFHVVQAPLDWPLTRQEIDEIAGLPPKEAIREGRVKNSPYTVRGVRYQPMSVGEARSYREVGEASWYGWETRNRSGGHMTANGEAFDPQGLTAAHKYLPLPTYVRVTNLENRRSISVRVNDRGPFPTLANPDSGERIIDLSMGAAKRLGFYRRGTARVLVETVEAG
jgi:rare lipoprotein A